VTERAALDAYRRWRDAELDPPSCPDLDIVREYVRRQAPSGARSEALLALERGRTTSANLRHAAKALALVLFVGVDDEAERVAAVEAT